METTLFSFYPFFKILATPAGSSLFGKFPGHRSNLSQGSDNAESLTFRPPEASPGLVFYDLSLPSQGRRCADILGDQVLKRHPRRQLLIIYLFSHFRATLEAYESSQTRGRIGAATGCHSHSHSNARSQLYLQLTPQLEAVPDP